MCTQVHTPVWAAIETHTNFSLTTKISGQKLEIIITGSKCVMLHWLEMVMTQMAYGHVGLDLHGRRPYGPASNGQRFIFETSDVP